MKLQFMKIIDCSNAQEKGAKERKGWTFSFGSSLNPICSSCYSFFYIYIQVKEKNSNKIFLWFCILWFYVWSFIIYGSILSSDILLEDKCGFTDSSRVQGHLSCNDSEIHAMLNNISNVDNTAIAAHVMCAYTY
jgi:hypothetical protein